MKKIAALGALFVALALSFVSCDLPEDSTPTFKDTEYVKLRMEVYLFLGSGGDKLDLNSDCGLTKLNGDFIWEQRVVHQRVLTSCQ